MDSEEAGFFVKLKVKLTFFPSLLKLINSTCLKCNKKLIYWGIRANKQPVQNIRIKTWRGVLLQEHNPGLGGVMRPTKKQSHCYHQTVISFQ